MFLSPQCRLSLQVQRGAIAEEPSAGDLNAVSGITVLFRPSRLLRTNQLAPKGESSYSESGFKPRVMEAASLLPEQAPALENRKFAVFDMKFDLLLVRRE